MTADLAYRIAATYALYPPIPSPTPERIAPLAPQSGRRRWARINPDQLAEIWVQYRDGVLPLSTIAANYGCHAAVLARQLFRAYGYAYKIIAGRHGPGGELS